MKSLQSIVIASVFAVLTTTSAFAQDKMANNIDNSNIALQGYSPVSYLDMGLAQKGLKAHVSEHNKIKYFFTSAQQKAAFDANPSRYLPQYGGYCAFGCYAEAEFRVDPTKFIVQDGKYFLYLNNIELDAKQLWLTERNHEKLRSTADKNWLNLSRTHN